MAVRETHILLDFVADADPLREVNQQINNTIRSTRDLAAGYDAVTDATSSVNRQMNDTLRNTRDVSKNYDGLTDASKLMLKEMKRGWVNQNDAFKKFKNQLVEAEYGYHNLARGTAFFGDSTDDLMRAIGKVGAMHKKATDGMMANNEMLRKKFYQTIGTFANMTPQAEKNRKALERMNNPLYNANKLGLGIVNKLSKVAYNANAAAMALKLLGPTASMKELDDEAKRLKKGLGALPLLLIGVGLGAIVFYNGMHKMALGNKEYAESWENMKAKLRKAIQPMVDAFAMIMTPIYNFIAGVADLIIKFNEAHPTIAKMIGAVLVLIPAFTLLLLPLGLGIGLVNGYIMVFGYLFKMIMPLVTFLATLSATVWIVVIAIVAFAAAFIWAWNNVAWFRDGIIAAWNWIKAKTIEVFNAIKTAIMPALQAIVAFGAEKLAEFRSIWQTNGGWIVALVTTHFKNIWAVIKMVMGIIKGIFQVIWPQISAIIQVAWALIKIIISTAINVVMGIIKAVMSLIQGDWEGAWSAIRGIFTDTWNDIKNYLGAIDLRQIGADIIKGLINGIMSMVGAVTDAVSGIAKNIAGALSPNIKMPKWMGGGPKADGSHKTGLGRVPFDGYKAVLHKDEAVLTAEQASTLRSTGTLTGESSYATPTYTPESNSTTSNTNNSSNRSLVFSPTIQVVEKGGGTSSIKQQVREAMDEAYSYLNTVYAVDGDY